MPALDETLRRRISWAVLIIACLSYVSLGLAQGGAGSATVDGPPSAPLPFSRERVFGVDLRHFTSLQARDWLNAAGNPSLALVLVPIDADVISALAQEETRPAALTAIDSLVQAAGDSPVGVCLRQPGNASSGLGVAQAALGVLAERYPSRIVYVSACDDVSAEQWQRDIGRASAAAGRSETDASGALFPLSTGSIVHITSVAGTRYLTRSGLGSLDAPAPTVVIIDAAGPIDTESRERVENALRDSPQLALVLIRPSVDYDPTEVVMSIQNATIPGDELPEGFSSVSSSGLTIDEGWKAVPVGNVSYLRAGAGQAALAADFVGTHVYLLALEAPDGGQIEVWIDPAATGPAAVPDLIFDLEGDQARDVVVPLAEGLPAARHRLVLQAVNGDDTSVAISGFFVLARPAPPWTAAAAAAGLAVIAVCAVAERLYASVVTIRTRIRPPARQLRTGHPRVFTRSR